MKNEDLKEFMKSHFILICSGIGINLFSILLIYFDTIFTYIIIAILSIISIVYMIKLMISAYRIGWKD